MRQNSGFTVMEVAVVIGLFALLIALALLMSMDVWRGSSFQSEQDIILSLLYKARSRAVSNINESNHGLCIDQNEHKYIVFEGDDCDAGGTEFDMSNGFAFTGDACTGNTCAIVFSAHTGMTDGDSFTMTGQGKTREFTINPEGGITW